MEGAKSLMMNSCDVLPINRIDEKFDELDLYEQGEETYIKIALDEMFTISNTVVTVRPTSRDVSFLVGRIPAKATKHLKSDLVTRSQ